MPRLPSTLTRDSISGSGPRAQGRAGGGRSYGAVDRGPAGSWIYLPEGVACIRGSENMKGERWSQLQLREPQRRTLGEEEQKREEMSYTRQIWGSSWRELSHQ